MENVDNLRSNGGRGFCSYACKYQRSANYLAMTFNSLSMSLTSKQNKKFRKSGS